MRQDWQTRPPRALRHTRVPAARSLSGVSPLPGTHMGAASSRLGSLVSSGTGPASLTTADADGERFCGLENFGNTCYANSVLQALYGCTRFRQAVLAHYGGLSAAQASNQEDTLLTTLGEVFAQVRKVEATRCTSTSCVRDAGALWLCCRLYGPLTVTVPPRSRRPRSGAAWSPPSASSSA